MNLKSVAVLKNYTIHLFCLFLPAFLFSQTQGEMDCAYFQVGTFIYKGGSAEGTTVVRTKKKQTEKNAQLGDEVVTRVEWVMSQISCCCKMLI